MAEQKVTLTKDRERHKKGDTLTLPDWVARDLIASGEAEAYQVKEDKTEEQTKEDKTVRQTK